MSPVGPSGRPFSVDPQDILDVFPHLMWGTDDEGQWVYTNQRLRTFTGHAVSPTEQDFLSILHPDDRQRVQASWQQARLERQTSSLELRLQHRDGQFRWMLCQYQPVEQGNAGFAWCGTCTDIHAQRQRLKDAGHIIETSRDCIKFIDLQGRLVYMNAGGMQEMEISDFGVCDHAFWPEFWSGAMRSQVEGALEEARAGRVGLFEGFCPTFAGTPKWWNVRVSPMYGPSGELERFLAVSRDITDRVQAELQAERWQSVSTALTGALSQEEVVDIVLSQGLSALQADAGGVMLVSPDGEHLEALSHRGYPEDMVQRFSRIPLSLSIPITEIIRDGVARFLTSEDINVQYPHLAEQRGDMRGSALLPLSMNGRVVGALILGFKRDRAFGTADRRFLITLATQCAQALERARLYDSVRELNQRLEQRVQERTSELERERSFMQAMLESLTEGIVACDANGVLTVFNRATRALHGLPAEPLPPELWADRYRLYQPDGVTPLRTEEIPLYRAFSGERVRDVDMVVVPQDGQARYLRTNGNAIYSTSGEKLGAVVAMHDITETRAAHAELERVSAFNHLLLDSVGEGIFGVDMQGLTTFANPAAERMIGYSREELLGQSQHALIHHTKASDEHYPSSECPIYCSRLDGAVRRVDDEVFWRKDGTSFPVEYISTPLRNARGEIEGAVVTFRDITERKRSEEKLRQANEELRRSNAELEQFAYVASHDLQEPLRTVASFTELLARRYQGRLDEHADTYITHVTQGVQRMKRLIEDLLSFSRLNATPQRSTVRVTEALNAARAQLALAIRETGALITHDTLPSLSGDAGQLTQLFQNLIGNALKFRRADVTPQIHIGAVREGAMWHFTVRDNGIGIEQPYFERIFVIFQRLHLREKFDGTGIGLAICRKIVEHHGGRIWVESTVGEGSVFHFTLSATATTE
ncbi:PAS domain S-box protein [Deinococcus peraridilitoris]|uniref:histidine kinase n=1 Tax=Deinococcus peraridilitoris (strain DSM 19664 / LMG 22246 / CIP 109416 / KR-200) TaxID=937777 RepID=L0A1J7_DEIPD|nr:PAS domain S-box protein [Deinococcus peraridilitoris]AFZ67324.1 PAS domain S-box [Deinococcus peraridilitoris DSM 19664]